jgi:leader peptidase (prepilin peptidase)/N-methyltransferase
MVDPRTLEVFLSPYVLAMLGLCIGSFLNVVIHRLPLMMERSWRLDSAELLGVQIEPPAPISLSAPRSRCPHCGHPITWYENIPLLSYLWLRGRCSACKAPISLRYPSVEVVTALLFVACGLRFGARPEVLLWCGFCATLVALALIDADTQYLPDDLTLPLLWAGIIAAALGWLPIKLGTSVGGAAAGYLSLWAVFHLYRLIRGKEGMGAGDFKLLAALGAWLGWPLIPSIILLASAVGAVVGIALIVARRHDREVPIPFGPYLAGGGIAALFFGDALTRLWMPPV